ncbi:MULTISPECIES: hypothetical protein [Nocardiopsis]|uniref:hypothetical protein n=1 Tax=Nocardiopsis TaxID=2013 RepID=UPI00117D5035|nr:MULTISPECIES: hypothetical protein [Nocardiopsis]
MRAPTAPLPTRTGDLCTTGCRSLLLDLDAASAVAAEDHHAYTCARCRGLVCALCGTTPVRWAGYICRRCVAPAPAPLTAKQLRAALSCLADDEVVLFHAHGKTWAVADTPAERPGAREAMTLIAT